MRLFGKKEDPYTFYDADGYDSYNPYAEEETESQRKRRFAPSIPLALGAVYLFVLLVGAFSTNFLVDATGTKVAQVADVTLREERDNYNQLRGQYLILATLVEAATEIDQRLASSGGRDTFALATEYSALLGGLDENLKFAKALPIAPKYNPAKELVITIYQDEAIYLQKMSKALNDQDVALLQEAFTWREKSLRDFARFQGNMKTFANNVKVDDPVLLQFQPPLPQGEGESASPAEASPARSEIPVATP